jgi:hypothetical protein
MKKLKVIKKGLSRNELRNVFGGGGESLSSDLTNFDDPGISSGGGYCGGTCTPGSRCSSSGRQSCGCSYDLNNPLVTYGFCVAHG